MSLHYTLKTHVFEREKHASWYKLSKEHLTVTHCETVSENHELKVVEIGKS
jgi:hypothetical protein